MDRRLRVTRNLVLSFALTILAGTLALSLPAAVAPGQDTLPFIDALFIATSAVCVTGLSTIDVPVRLAFAGEAILLALIQVGGLGILTFSNLAMTAAKKKLGIGERMLVEESHGGLPSIEPRVLLRRIMLYTFGIEAVGAAILTLRFWADHPFPHAAWLGVFHSVSAFCNAGFALFSNNLESYPADAAINFTIMALIVLGGLGFLVFTDISLWMAQLRAGGIRRLSLHTRVVLRTTFGLLVVGMALFFILEKNTPSSTHGTFFQQAMQSMFLSVTARTAGFNTLPMTQLTNPSILVLIILMFIGASPGSTGGGIKTTTFAILNALVFSRARNRPKVELLRRSVPADAVGKALATVAAFILIVLVATIALQIVELRGLPHAQVPGSFLPHLFEVVSALGTVGLSLNLTPTLSTAGKIVIVCCMFLGRVGPLVLIASLIGMRKQLNYTYPEERILVG